uniref:Retrovirus-related Pol polyprotein from transposon TNT 1-94 n=1 Tax=Cajanus cajan TaxID=3821 RepID=A0A151RB67_CAJCA|nr:Retrovirus-related Pol polyprotein from transposon TNT 1-94 [Cajanus cajan]
MELKDDFVETKEEVLLMEQVGFEKVETKYVWFLDSRSSNHMCGRKKAFIEIEIICVARVSMEGSRDIYKSLENKSSQNNVAERKNKTIMNMVRCMLLEKQIPKRSWPEALNLVMHVLNQSPTFAVKNKTPEEAWNGQKPSVKHFRVFGSLCHVHVPDRKIVKLDDKNWDWDDSHEQAILTNLQNEINEETIIVDERDKEESTTNEDTRHNEYYNNDSEGLLDGERMNLAYLILTCNGDPITYDDVVKSEKWRQAMDHEIEAIINNDMWEQTDLPTRGKTIGVKWIFKTKNTLGYIFIISSGADSWSSKKQLMVSLSTYDNISAIKLLKNLVMHGYKKHIDVYFYFLRYLVKDGIVELLQCSTHEQIEDTMTKLLKLEVFLKLQELMGVCKYP